MVFAGLGGQSLLIEEVLDRDVIETAMRRCLDLASLAGEAGEVPIGAIVLGPDGAVLGEGFNQRNTLGDPTAHAEMIALRAAAGVLGVWNLTGCSLVATLEPCVMCAGAIWASRVSAVYFGAASPDNGACGSLYNFGPDPRLNHRFSVEGGVLGVEAGELLAEFFKTLR